MSMAKKKTGIQTYLITPGMKNTTEKNTLSGLKMPGGMTIIESILYTDSQYCLSTQESDAWYTLRESYKKEYRKLNECLHDRGTYFHQDNSRDGWNAWECVLCGARTVDKKKWL